MEKIPSVSVHQQRDVDIYTFALSAEQLLKLCRIERFGEVSEGVNRKYDEAHAKAISAAMADGKSLWLEPILGDLRPEWKLRSGELISYDEDDYISVDDGQHRLAALRMLNPAERARLWLNVTATMNLPYVRRLEVFRQQTKRKPIDARLDLAQRYKLGDWKTQVEKEAYELVLKLNSEQSSPLRDKILLAEEIKRVYEGQHRPVGVNAKGLVVTLRTLVGGRSPLHVLSPDKRAQVVITMITVAADIWKKEWESERHILTTARGINAILALLVRSVNFAALIGKDFSQESIRNALQFADTFDWGKSKNKNDGVNRIVDRLDQAINRNVLKRHDRAAMEARSQGSAASSANK